MSIITKLFGTYSDHQLKKLEPIVSKIEGLAKKYADMSESELRGVTAQSGCFSFMALTIETISSSV